MKIGYTGTSTSPAPFSTSPIAALAQQNLSKIAKAANQHTINFGGSAGFLALPFLADGTTPNTGNTNFAGYDGLNLLDMRVTEWQAMGISRRIITLYSAPNWMVGPGYASTNWGPFQCLYINAVAGSGATTVTSSSNILPKTSVAVGCSVIGAGIAGGTTITAVSGTGSSITLSTATTGAVSGIWIPGLVPDATAASGATILTCPSTQNFGCSSAGGAITPGSAGDPYAQALVGQTVTGTGIVAGTTVVSVQSANQITLSQATNGAVSGVIIAGFSQTATVAVVDQTHPATGKTFNYLSPSSFSLNPYGNTPMVLDKYVGDFAAWCHFLVARYLPQGVTHYMVWNELKGLYVNGLDGAGVAGGDYNINTPPSDVNQPTSYVKMYNAIWDAVKGDAATAAAQIGGPYAVVNRQGNGMPYNASTNANGKYWSRQNPTSPVEISGAWGEVDPRITRSYRTFAQYAHGFDFIVTDNNLAYGSSYGQHSAAGQSNYNMHLYATFFSDVTTWLTNNICNGKPIIVGECYWDTATGSPSTDNIKTLLDAYEMCANVDTWLLWHGSANVAGLFVTTTGTITDVGPAALAWQRGNPLSDVAKATALSRNGLNAMTTAVTPAPLILQNTAGTNLPARGKLRLAGALSSVSDDAGNSRIVATMTDPAGLTPTLNPQPSDFSLTGWTFPNTIAGGSAIALTAGRLFVNTIDVFAGTVRQIKFLMGSSVPAGLTNTYIGIYQNDNLVATTADLSSTLGSSWTNGTVRSITLTAAVATGTIKVAFLIGGATTAPSVSQAVSTTSRNAANAGLGVPTTLPSSRSSQTVSTTITSLPSTLSSITSWQNGPALWIGVS
jgi:hypothetical protein